MHGAPVSPVELPLAAAVMIATRAVAGLATAGISRARQGITGDTGAGRLATPPPVPVLVPAPAGLCSAAFTRILFVCLVL
jgi:hypothetical protein